MLNYAVYGGTAGQYPLDKVLNFDFGLGFVPVVQPTYSFNIAHVYPTSKIKQVVDLTHNNWDNLEGDPQSLWNLITWLYQIDPDAYVKVLPLRMAPLFDPYGNEIPANALIQFNGKIFLRRM